MYGQSAQSGTSRIAGHSSSGDHQNHPSWDFGPFTDAPSSARPVVLEVGDLLGSFEDIGSAGAGDSKDLPSGSRDGGKVSMTYSRPYTADKNNRLFDPVEDDLSLGSQPVHINLPPRPTEISPDYIPRREIVRRSSGSFAGPSSPPLLSRAGHDTVYRPTVTAPDAESRLKDPQAARRTSSTGRSSQSSLIHTLATTSKMATKWKSVLDPSSSARPPPLGSIFDRDGHKGTQTELASGSNELSFTALPVEVTHTTPFATAEQLSGIYVPPSGAPGLQQAHLGNACRSVNEKDRLRLQLDLVDLVGRHLGTAEVLTKHVAGQIRAALPPRKRISAVWPLLFSIDQHGQSLSTLYRLVERYAIERPDAGNVLVIRDAENRVFGVFLHQSIVKREGTYYGSGESFMFKVDTSTNVTRFFKWTGRNQYFALCENDFISFGGGGPSYGLILDSAFKQNSSATSPAYDNEVLCSDGIYSDKAVFFECLGLEVWGTQA